MSVKRTSLHAPFLRSANGVIRMTCQGARDVYRAAQWAIRFTGGPFPPDEPEDVILDHFRVGFDFGALQPCLLPARTPNPSQVPGSFLNSSRE